MKSQWQVAQCRFQHAWFSHTQFWVTEGNVNVKWEKQDIAILPLCMVINQLNCGILHVKVLQLLIIILKKERKKVLLSLPQEKKVFSLYIKQPNFPKINKQIDWYDYFGYTQIQVGNNTNSIASLILWGCCGNPRAGWAIETSTSSNIQIRKTSHWAEV